jgi:hypothetical protein
MWPASHWRLLLPMLLVAAGTGCVSVPPYRAHPDLLREKPAIRTVGVLPPKIAMFEERARFGLNATVAHEEWSRAAEEAVADAFADEMAADGIAMVPIGVADDPEAEEIAELSAAVDFSILRHAFEKNSGEVLFREPFDEQLRAFGYSIGSAADLMDRHRVDAVWIVRGFNLLPTAGARAKHGADITLAILGALGGVAVPVLDLQKIQLRVTLIDRSGTVLYYGLADGRAGKPEAEDEYVAVDLRDARAARHYLRAALADYRAQGPP